jgi:putative membrane protein
MTTRALETRNDRPFLAAIGVLSAGALAFLAWLLLGNRDAEGGLDLHFVPAINACLNGGAAIALVAGFIAIRRKRPDVHRFLMVTAFVFSTLFLSGYVIYHYVHGDTKYEGEGTARTIYFVILASHVLLSMAVVPLSLTTFYFAVRKRFRVHRAIAKITLPIWLYVSVTGVVIYFMLH